MGLVLILVALIAFIVLSTTRLKLHPFLALLAAALIAGFAYQLPGGEIIKTMTAGFGGILGYIGIVIVLGTIIGACFGLFVILLAPHQGFIITLLSLLAAIPALRAAGKPYKYLAIPDMGHQYNRWEVGQAAEVLTAIDSYLTTECGPGGL